MITADELPALSDEGFALYFRRHQPGVASRAQIPTPRCWRANARRAVPGDDRPQYPPRFSIKDIARYRALLRSICWRGGPFVKVSDEDL